MLIALSTSDPAPRSGEEKRGLPHLVNHALLALDSRNALASCRASRSSQSPGPCVDRWKSSRSTARSTASVTDGAAAGAGRRVAADGEATASAWPSDAPCQHPPSVALSSFTSPATAWEDWLSTKMSSAAAVLPAPSLPGNSAKLSCDPFSAPANSSLHPGEASPDPASFEFMFSGTMTSAIGEWCAPPSSVLCPSPAGKGATFADAQRSSTAARCRADVVAIAATW